MSSKAAPGRSWTRRSATRKMRRFRPKRRRLPASTRLTSREPGDDTMPEMTLIDAIREAMDEELANDPHVFITGEDVGPRGGVFRATMGLFEKYGPTRIVDSPLAELSIVAVGIGAA